MALSYRQDAELLSTSLTVTVKVLMGLLNNSPVINKWLIRVRTFNRLKGFSQSDQILTIAPISVHTKK